jgi:toxin ParE1/3/4
LKLRYTPKALAELADILAYIAERSPQGARNVQARILAITAFWYNIPVPASPLAKAACAGS